MEVQFSFNDLMQLIDRVAIGDWSEHERYSNDLIRLNFHQEEDSRGAIRKWLLPEYERCAGRTEIGRARVKEALTVAISRWGFLPYFPNLPGIDEDPPYRPIESTFSMLRQFYRWLWDECFHEPFVPKKDTEGLHERIDTSFTNAPNDPTQWGVPKYRPLSYWDREMTGGQG